MVTSWHVVKMAVTPSDLQYLKNPRYMQTSWRYHRVRVMGDRTLHCGNRNFLPFWLLWPWPWPDNLHIWTWPVLLRETLDLQIWTSYIPTAFESYRLTDTQTDRQVTHDHFQSCDKDGGHTIRSAVFKNPMLHAKLMPLSFIEPNLWAIKVYIVGIGILDNFSSCDLNLDPMTFIHELDAYCLEIYRMWKYERCAKMNFLCQSFQKLLFDRQTYRHTIHTYTQTESTEIIDHAASWVVNNGCQSIMLKTWWWSDLLSTSISTVSSCSMNSMMLFVRVLLSRVDDAAAAVAGDASLSASSHLCKHHSLIIQLSVLPKVTVTTGLPQHIKAILAGLFQCQTRVFKAIIG